MLQGGVCGHALAGIDGETLFDEVASRFGDITPVFDGREGVIGGEDGLHFFQVGVPVEGGVATEEEVGYHADGPDITGEALVDIGAGMWWARGAALWHVLTLVCRGQSS